MKYVLVTGAFGGMGKETVRKLKDDGYIVFAMDKHVCTCENGIIPIEADITSEESVLDAFEKVRSITSELYGIIHFAGVYVLDSLVEIGRDSFIKAFDINVFGAFAVNKIFLPLIEKGGRIIITTSELAPLDPLPFTGLYAVTKGALDKYAYSLCMELRLLDISVSVLRAGAVKTDMLKVSTDELEKFCNSTKLYLCNARRFRAIVDKIEARSVTAEKLSIKALKILKAKKPRFAYSINRNPLLLLMSVLPKRIQLWIINMILK